MKYEAYTEITKEVLDKVQVGDLVKINDWKAPYRCKGVSENYFVVTRNAFGNVYYSICEKNPWPGIKHNAMTGGMFHISTDDLVFGWSGGYNFDDQDNMREYLQALEAGEIGLSERRGCPVTYIAIKKGE